MRLTIIAVGEARLEFTLLGIFFGLIVKGSIDALFARRLRRSKTVAEFIHIIWTPTTFQFTVLLLTLVRFMYGAYRFYEVEPQRSPAYLVWNTFVMIFLFILFYFAGLAVSRTRTFYSLIVGIHACDFLWFLVTRFYTADVPARDVLCRFLSLDVGTVISVTMLLVVLRDTKGHSLLWIGGIILLLIGGLDIWLNQAFYFPQRRSTSANLAPTRESKERYALEQNALTFDKPPRTGRDFRDLAGASRLPNRLPFTTRDGTPT